MFKDGWVVGIWSKIIVGSEAQARRSDDRPDVSIPSIRHLALGSAQLPLLYHLPCSLLLARHCRVIAHRLATPR
jgi:hypothetical protein